MGLCDEGLNAYQQTKFTLTYIYTENIDIQQTFFDYSNIVTAMGKKRRNRFLQHRNYIFNPFTDEYRHFNDIYIGHVSSKSSFAVGMDRDLAAKNV